MVLIGAMTAMSNDRHCGNGNEYEHKSRDRQEAVLGIRSLTSTFKVFLPSPLGERGRG